MRDNDPVVKFDDIEVINETDKAILVNIDGEEHWIPKSQIHADSEVFEMGTSGTLIVSEWIATQKKLV